MRSLLFQAFVVCVAALAAQSGAIANPERGGAAPATSPPATALPAASASPASIVPSAQPSTVPSAPATAIPSASAGPMRKASTPVAKPSSTPAVKARPAPSKALSKDAPADDYFGPLKLSALRIRLMIDQLAQRYDRRTIADDDLLHDAGEAETAMWSWLSQYPHDAWGAPTALHLAQLYADVQTDAARADARRAFAYVAHNYGGTKQGHLAKVRLAQGFPPLHEETAVVPTPGPSGAGVIDASVQASPSAAASTAAGPPSSAATATPSLVPAR